MITKGPVSASAAEHKKNSDLNFFILRETSGMVTGEFHNSPDVGMKN